MGTVVSKDKVLDLCRYYKVQETIGCVYKMVRKHKDIYETDAQIMSIVNALAGNLVEEEKTLIVEEVKKKQKEPETESADADDFDNVYEDTERVEAGKLLPLGTRVLRGRDWKWNNQDTEGAGTVIQHRKKQDGWLHVMWDNDTHNAYRYGDDDCFDVAKTDNHPRLPGSHLIEIGMQVVRGEDWGSGEEDGHGVGVVIRRRKDGKVKVRWENGHIGKYKYGQDGKMELEVKPLKPCETKSSQPTSQIVPDEELGAVGGHDPSEGSRRPVWQFMEYDVWQTYPEAIQDKLLSAYKQRSDGTCVVNRDGKDRRILFKQNREKTVDRGGGMLDVQMLELTDEEYHRMLNN